MLFRYCAFAVLLVSAAPSQSESVLTTEPGQVCLAAAPVPNDGSKSLANPTGGNPDVEYSVKIGDKDFIVLSRESSMLVTGLDRSKRHPVVILEDGEPLTSFLLFVSG